MGEVFWDINLPLILNEAKNVLFALQEFEKRHYNEIVSIARQRLEELIDEEEREDEEVD